jgi:SAM-dependent methyltransferase
MNPTDMPANATQPAPDTDTDRAWSALHSAASTPYRATSHWAYHWARGKLGHDPVFRGMLSRGDLPAQARVVDIGCGQGLVASLLQACADLQRAGGWPAAWPVAASARSYLGVELMPKDVARGNAALRGLALKPHLVCADMCKAEFPACDVVVILDVLHYVDHAAQDVVLQRVRGALSPEPGKTGRLLLRVGDADNARGFAWSQWVDRIVTWARGHRVPPTFGRPLKAWVALLEGQGFAVRAVPQSEGTPFANVLLIADLKGAAA